jgi:hypothetical protein
MSKDRLERLLQRADAMAGGVSAVPAGLGGLVRGRARQQHRVRTVGSAVATLIVLAVGAVSVINFSGRPRLTPNATTVVQVVPGPIDVAQLQARVQRLREEILAGCNATQEALDREELDNRVAAMQGQTADDPLQEVNDQIDRAALTMVYQADRMYRELNLRESAIASYERTVKLFPATHWAEVAKERLTEIQASRKGDAS